MKNYLDGKITFEEIMTGKKHIKETKACRLCKSENIKIVLDFGETALANSYLTKEQLKQKEFKAPLQVFLCQDCGSVQLKHTVDPDILFSNYLYESSTSKAFQEHFSNYAKNVAKTLGLKPKDCIVDIGSNDGILLKPFKDFGLNVLGIEPAKNLASMANSKGLPTVNRFFDQQCVKDCLTWFGGKAKLVTCNNCFAHIDNLHEIVKGVKEILTPDGVFIFENAYLLDTINQYYFDQIYSEHLFFHSILPLSKFFKSHGMTLFRVERNDIQGGTIRVFVSKDSRKIEDSVLDCILLEKKFKLENPQTYVDFMKSIDDLKEEFDEFISEAMIDGKRICAYGAPAKLTTFAKVFNLTNDIIDFVIDDSALKQNRYTPGTHIPILPSSALLDANPDYCLITAWNFEKTIRKNNPKYKGKWVLCMPEFKVI